MKYKFAIFFSLLSVISSAQNNAVEFQTLYDNGFISVTAEKALFETAKSKHFFIHYRIKNLSENNIGVYTDAYFGLFYPNQWGIETKAERGIVDERRIIPMALNDSIINFIETKYKNGQLTLIQPDSTYDYYRDFNASKKKDVQLKSGEFMFVSMDGQLLITNGSRIEHAHFDDRFFQTSSIFLPYPLIWKTIPTNSIIFNED